MRDLDSTTVAAVQATLDELLPDQRYVHILELLAVVGCADALQLQSATGLSRDKLALAMQRMSEATPGLPPLFFHPRDKVSQPGKRGAPAKIYCLGETGAAVLRAAGQTEAHPCGLDEDVDITHALATLEVHLLAQSANLPVRTEKRLPAGEVVPYLRPDNLVTLADGTQALFETEQLLTAQHVARAIESLQNKWRFFKPTAGKQVSSMIRVVFNLPNGKDYQRTLKVWQYALRVVTQRYGGKLPFRLLAMPLADFKAAPDWTEPPQAQRWTDLTPAQTEQPMLPAEKRSAASTQLAPKLPSSLRRYSTHESALVLNALWLAFCEGTAVPTTNAKAQQPDPALFEVAGIIYAAAHDKHLTSLERAGFPHAALYLLKQYFRLRPTLFELLKEEIVRGAQAVRWNSIAITHRMQIVCEKFLRYHGFSDSGPLLVRALSADWMANEPQHFKVRVDIREPEILLVGDGVVPNRSMVTAAEAALSWLLTALFTYAEDLDLPRPPFW